MHLVTGRTSGTRYACKHIRKPRKSDPRAYEQLQREVALMKTVNHRYIVKLFHVYETPKGYSMVMEL